MAIKSGSNVIVSDTRVLSNVTDLDNTTINTFSNGMETVGDGGTWIQTSKVQDVLYQNTFGKPILVTILFSGSARYVWYGPNSSTLYTAMGTWFASEFSTSSIIVPDGWYYKTNATVTSWYELR